MQHLDELERWIVRCPQGWEYLKWREASGPVELTRFSVLDAFACVRDCLDLQVLHFALEKPLFGVGQELRAQPLVAKTRVNSNAVNLPCISEMLVQRKEARDRTVLRSCEGWIACSVCRVHQ